LASLIAPRVSFFLLLLFLSFFFLFLFTEDTDDDKRSHPKLIRRPRRLGFADILFLPLRRIRRRLLMEYKCLPSRHFLSLLRALCCLYNMADMLNCF
jgi:hypothetical protein